MAGSQNRIRALFLIGIVAGGAFLFWPSAAFGQSQPLPLPTLKIGVGESKEPGDISVLIQILFILTVLSLAPAILIMMTCFTRIVVVFSFLRSAMGIHQMPPNQVMVGLSLFLTFFIMTPVLQTVRENAWIPYRDKKISQEQALEEAMKPIRQFMLRQTREKDLALFIEMAKIAKPRNRDELPTTVLLPAFMVSELKTAFQMGFILFLPFLVIDMVVASVLLSMGMMMLPPVMISLPFKILLFVTVDGWHLVVGSMVRSFY